jgi:predicted nucleic acid-binding protein
VTGVVLDASVAVNLCIEQPQTPEAVRLWAAFVEHEVFVPPIWHSEVANALLRLRRRGIDTRDMLVEAAGYLDALEVVVADEPSLCRVRSILDTAERADISAYDGLYVRLALVKSLPLLTLDGALKTKAAAAGVRIPLE